MFPTCSTVSYKRGLRAQVALHSTNRPPKSRDRGSVPKIVFIVFLSFCVSRRTNGTEPGVAYACRQEGADSVQAVTSHAICLSGRAVLLLLFFCGGDPDMAVIETKAHGASRNCGAKATAWPPGNLAVTTAHRYEIGAPDVDDLGELREPQCEARPEEKPRWGLLWIVLCLRGPLLLWRRGSSPQLSGAPRT